MIAYKKFFPYKTIRNDQDQVLKQIAKNWDNKRYFILQLDVGVGKSGVAKTVANWCENAFIITETKQLQEQYKRDFKKEGNIISLKGKANYSCNENPKLNCECGKCIDLPAKQRSKLECRKTCKYYHTRELAKKTQVVVTSYAYILRAFECAGFWKHRELVVFDECHSLEEQLVNFAQFTIDLVELKEYKVKINAYTHFTENGWNANADIFQRVFNQVKSRRDKLFIQLQEDIATTKKSPDKLDEDILDVIKAKHWGYYQLDKLYKKMEIFTQCNPEDWLIEIISSTQLTFKPVDVGYLFYKYAAPIGEKFIFMSATILDTDKFRRMLRLPEEQCLTIKIESSFNPDNSPIYFVPCGQMNYQHLSKSLPQTYKTVQQILKDHNGERGIIHTGSYDVANKIVKNVHSKRFTNKIKNETNEELLEEHLHKKNSVLVSPSMTTGVDLKDDLSRFQIIVKMPFKSLSDKRISVKAKSDFNWYATEMLKSLIQACGRSTRSKSDYSVTYILDESFPKWIKKYKDILPKQFLKRIHIDED